MKSFHPVIYYTLPSESPNLHLIIIHPLARGSWSQKMECFIIYFDWDKFLFMYALLSGGATTMLWASFFFAMSRNVGMLLSLLAHTRHEVCYVDVDESKGVNWILNAFTQFTHSYYTTKGKTPCFSFIFELVTCIRFLFYLFPFPFFFPSPVEPFFIILSWSPFSTSSFFLTHSFSIPGFRPFSFTLLTLPVQNYPLTLLINKLL